MPSTPINFFPTFQLVLEIEIAEFGYRVSAASVFDSTLLFTGDIYSADDF